MDLGRGPDGTIYVLGDRTQAPSGAGYALENRIVLARMLPEVFRACKVQRLALFFRNFRDTLRNLAWHNRDNPRTVLLTPGPHDETYFEHAYLARYLGYTLAEGSDLTVRDQRVYLKLLDGLLPVDVIWRRLADEFCDPLELRHDSFLGVPGLVQAVRSGNVVVANALGSGLAESAALLPYLPALCRNLLGEELQIPSVPAYWCGAPQACEHVLANLSRMVIKAAFPALRLEPIFPEELSEEQRRHLQERIRAKPWAYVGQEHLELSTTPVLAESNLQPRHMVVRVYVAAHENSFQVMPGGLTRVTGSADSMIVSMQKGGGSKDTWMLTEGPITEFSLLRAGGQRLELSRGGNDLPSRAADNLFWLGRYVQRAEDMVRLLRGIFVRLTEKAGLADVPELPVLLRALTHLTQTLPGFMADDGKARLAAPREELFSLIFQRERVGSLAYNFQSIHRSAASVRDRISMDMWRILSSLSLEKGVGSLFPERGEKTPDPFFALTLSDVLDLLDQRVITLAGFGGIAMESMTRGHGWRFLEMGRKIERGLHTAGLLRCTLAAGSTSSVASAAPDKGKSDGSTSEIPLLEALLEIADSSMTYRRRYLGGVQAGPVLDLLLADESNPRALVFHLKALHDVIAQLPKDPTRAGLSPEERLILSLVTGVQLADITQLSQTESGGQRKNLEGFLTWLEKELPALAELIAQRYMSHLQKSRQLAGAEDL
jgi:uncharacterized alpha-E superfamily protein